MYELNASPFYEAIIILQQVIALVQKPDFPKGKVMTSGSRESSVGSLTKLKGHVVTLKCQVTEMAIDGLLRLLSKDENLTYYAYGWQALNISSTFKNELTLKKVYVLDPLKADFFDSPKPLFGDDVARKFPSVSYEIDQAGKCYACDLTTASAFHSLRCLEGGIRAVARCLYIPDPIKGKDRNWSNVNRAIKDEIDKRWPPATGRMSGDAQLFDEIYGALAGMQNPYRNSTMHLESVYTAPDAIHLYELVKGLMSRIASRMDENGLPLA